ncbi:hypothetical protein Taro_048756 [Colocasia esculenta]|uniref:Cytochrome P450 n=1 Tax=Colocasia esculenta TaxID=4460 RepID=A0A843X917_COLES|nr:hypothetical protein [Colocasia esculenta]
MEQLSTFFNDRATPPNISIDLVGNCLGRAHTSHAAYPAEIVRRLRIHTNHIIPHCHRGKTTTDPPPVICSTSIPFLCSPIPLQKSPTDMELGTALLLLLLPFVALLLVYSGPVPWLKKKETNPSDPDGLLKCYPLIGVLPQFLKNRHRPLDWQKDLLAASPTNTIFLRLPGNVQGIVTANPANVEHILKSRFENYPKGPRFTSILEDFLGRGIFNADGELWRAQRKTASYEFNTKSLRNFVVENVQLEIRERLLPLLSRAARVDAVVDLQDVFERFAFDNVCRVSFNEDPGCLADEDGKGGGGRLSAMFALAFRDATSIVAGRFWYAIPIMWRIKKRLYIGSERRLRESISTVHDFATQIILSRKKKKQSSASSLAALPHQDLLSRFVAGEDNSDEYLRDIVISFLLAGRETTSSALSWFFWLLSSRPEVEHKILEELRSVRAARKLDSVWEGGEEAFAFEELKEMHYLQAVISEAMRLYPPVPVNSAVCVADDVLPDGTFVGKGWFMSYSSYAMGRMPAVWGEDCEEYRPERWVDEGGAFRPENPFRYPVFHAGPRTCLGKEMAYIQMKSIVASVLERFAVEVTEHGRYPEKMLSLTLRMRGGLPVRVRERAVVPP